ncbi:MAG TPA: hypothetical protein VGN44_11690, partial [Candidatus Angelobacter sp.]
RTLERRKMICHCACLVPIREFFGGVTEEPILLGFKGFGQSPPGQCAASVARLAQFVPVFLLLASKIKAGIKGV